MFVLIRKSKLTASGTVGEWPKGTLLEQVRPAGQGLLYCVIDKRYGGYVSRSNVGRVLANGEIVSPFGERRNGRKWE